MSNTSQFGFDCGNITPGTTRIITVPNADIRLPANFALSSSNLFTGVLTMPFLTGINNSCYGGDAGTVITSGTSNVIIGASANVDAGARTNCIVIGRGTISDTNDNSIKIGFGTVASTRAFIDGIRGRTTGAADAIAVLIDSNGQLGTVSSSRRYKENIEDMGNDTVLYGLRPVTFNYISDETKRKTYGLIAEEVNEVIPDIVARNKEGEIETVQYHLLVPMLLNAVIKHKKRADDMETYFNSRIAALEARIV